MATVTYTGPEDQTCHPLAEHGYSPLADPGTTYELPADLARSLASSSAHWTLGNRASGAPALSAKDAIAYLVELDRDELDLFAAGETRKSVLAAIAKRRGQLRDEEV